MLLNSNESSQRVLFELERNFKIKAEKIESVCSEIQSRYLQQGVDHSFRFYCRNPRDAMVLCCVSWYLPEILRLEVQIEISQRLTKKFGPEYEQKISLLLESKPKMLIYLLESNVLGYKTQEVFGNIIGSTTKLQVFQLSHRKPKRIQRHRGYRDKGSRRTGFEFLSEEEIDFTLRELQLQLEEERIAIQDSIQFWSGFMD
jgi:hypothetical protein